MGVVVDTRSLVAANRQGEPDTTSRAADWNRLLGRLAGEGAVLPAAVYAELRIGVARDRSPPWLPHLPEVKVTGGPGTYPACREEARHASTCRQRRPHAGSAARGPNDRVLRLIDIQQAGGFRLWKWSVCDGRRDPVGQLRLRQRLRWTGKGEVGEHVPGANDVVSTGFYNPSHRPSNPRVAGSNPAGRANPICQ